MRPVLLAFLLFLALAPLARADIYQCPDASGVLRYRDTPCAGDVPPLQQSPAPAPQGSTAPSPFLRPMLDALQCAQLGDIAATTARGRDNGTARLRLLGAMQRAAKDDATRAFLEVLVNTIYGSNMPVHVARQLGYDMCRRQGH